MVVRRNTDEVQSKANFDLFEELFADDFVDHRPQPAGTPDKSGARKLYYTLRAAFPDFHAIIHFAQRHSIVVLDSDSAPPTRSDIEDEHDVGSFIRSPSRTSAVG